MEARDLTQEALDRAEEIGGAGGLPWEVGFHAVALARLGERRKPSRRPGRSWSAGGVDAGVGLDGAPARLALGVAALARR